MEGDCFSLKAHLSLSILLSSWQPNLLEGEVNFLKFYLRKVFEIAKENQT